MTDEGQLRDTKASHHSHLKRAPEKYGHWCVHVCVRMHMCPCVLRHLETIGDRWVMQCSLCGSEARTWLITS